MPYALPFPHFPISRGPYMLTGTILGLSAYFCFTSVAVWAMVHGTSPYIPQKQGR